MDNKEKLRITRLLGVGVPLQDIQCGYLGTENGWYKPYANGSWFDGGMERKRKASSSEVFVIKPQEFDDAQTVVDFLKRGKAIVINMEGLQLEPAQRIIDFIGGACYGIEGDLKAISANIFIAVPNSIEVTGDLREEILTSTSVSPLLGE